MGLFSSDSFDSVVEVLNLGTGERDEPVLTDSTYLLHYALHFFKLYVVLAFTVDFLVEFPAVTDVWLFTAWIGGILAVIVHLAEQRLAANGNRDGMLVSVWDTAMRVSNTVFNYMSKIGLVLMFSAFGMFLMDSGVYSTEHAALLSEIHSVSTLVFEIGFNLSTVILLTFVFGVVARLAVYPGVPVCMRYIEAIKAEW